jgi:hypothetical protein
MLPHLFLVEKKHLAALHWMLNTTDWEGTG